MDGSSTTRERLLEAAVRLLGATGVQSVTHRSVEEQAGVARGSTRYHFGTREELLAAVLEHMAHSGGAVLEHVTDEPTQDEAMRAMTTRFLSDPEAERARFELFLYASRRPELCEAIARWRQGFVDMAAGHLAAHGATEPQVAARMTVAAMDGLILHALTGPHEDLQRHGPAWMAQLARVAAEFPGGDA
ncbi:TetR/AcrR family transcriptional regulator [Luteococcus sp. OSA5]|uniref:TetR/AcrR family transcriptional regulator n=1 Tax=Luteococcus sp. OSA5 TaxID=3401630 RepID=UPI003B4388A9